MRLGLGGAACAVMLAWTGQAQAARVLAVDIVATGSGLAFNGSRAGSGPPPTHAFAKLYVTAIFPLEGMFAPQPNGGGYDIGGFDGPLTLTGSVGSGFAFAATYPMQHFVSYALKGSACFADPDPATLPAGDQPVVPGCGSLSASYSDAFAVQGFTFDGTISTLGFSEREGGSVPSITFAIPEPATWAMMLAGFGLVAYAMRRRRAAVAIA